MSASRNLNRELLQAELDRLRGESDEADDESARQLADATRVIDKLFETVGKRG